MAETLTVNDAAPLRNVALFSMLVQKVVERRPGVDGMALFFGVPGLGKTKSAIKGANMYRAVYVTCGQYTTARSLLTDILTELGEQRVRGAVVDLIKQAIYLMAANRRRPLIVDEAHHVAAKRFVDVLRELHDLSMAPVILIGEETLPRRLQLFPQVKDRMLDEVQALPADASDFALLAKMYCPRVRIAADLAEKVIAVTRGNARRIVVNLAAIEEKAAQLGVQSLDLSAFGGEAAIARNTLIHAGRA